MDIKECPYATGAEFVLFLNTSKNCEDSSKFRILVRVIHLFALTNGQTMKVAIIAQPDGCSLPSTAFLKLYDRRFLRDRMEDQPWTHTGEVEAEKVWGRLREHVELASTDGGVLSDEFADNSSDEDDYEEELKILEQWDKGAVNNWEIEKRHSRDTKLWFRNECRAYQKLRPLQGLCIPRFYGTTEMDKTWKNPLYIHLDVYGILLEYIEGSTLEELNSESLLVNKHPHIGQATVDCFERITRFGVLHGDVNYGNVMVRHDGRVFLVDFAWALFRSDGESDEEWKEYVACECETSYIKILLDIKSLRDRTPPAPYTSSIHEYAMFNKLVENARERWRERYYEPTVYDSFYDEKSETECFVYTPSWRLRTEAVAERIKELAAFSKWRFEETENGSISGSTQ